MNRYHYKARNADGKMIQGEVDAEDQRKAAGYVTNLGFTPVSLRIAEQKGLFAGGDIGEILGERFKSRIPTSDLVIFTRHFKSLLHAGVPIIRGLKGLASNAENKRLARSLNDITGTLEGGGSLSEGLDRHRDVFPRLFIQMVGVGEQSGQLETALGQMGDNLEQERVTRQRVKSAMRYPTFVLVAIAIALAVVNIFVIPTFADLFESLDTELPLATRILLGTSNFTINYWPHILVGMIGVYLFTRNYLRSPSGRMRWDRIKLRLPIVGGVMSRALLARFSRTFAMALRAGVPLPTAVETVAEATDNVYIAEGIRGLRTGIERGESLQSVAEQSELFTPMVLQMLAVGEETGQLADLMDQVADFYEGEVEEDLENLPSYIEPVMIGFIGLLVFVLALGIFMPIWEMGSAM